MLKHTLVDQVLFLFLLLVPLVEWRWSWPRYLRKLASGLPGIRTAYYRRLVLSEWIPTASLLAFWIVRGRPMAALRLAGAPGFQLGIGLAYVLLLIGLLVYQRRALLRRTDRLMRVKKALASVEPLLPHTPSERKLFWLVSATAGICEEIFYRGFLTWYLSVWVGPVAAVLLASVIFGIGHVYLGIWQVPKTAIIGLIFAVIVSFAGSLWPAVLLHAAVDWNSGELGFRMVRRLMPPETNGEPDGA